MHVSSRLSSPVRPTSIALAILALVVAACAPAAPSPTAAPAKPTEAPKPAATSAPAKPAEAKPAEAKPAASPAAKAEAKPAEAKPAASPAAKTEARPAASPAAKPVTLPKPEINSFKIGFAALETNGFTAEYARDLGLYKKYGIEGNVESLFFEGFARTAQAAVAGQVEVVSDGISLSISTQKDVPTPWLTTGMFVSKLTDNLVSTSNVKTPAELKGKTVAVSTFGGDSHAAVLMALKGIGLTEKDVTIQQVGGQSARIAALKAGSIAAAPIDVTIEDQMKAEGFNILISLPKTPLQVAKTGLMIGRDFMQKNPNTTLAIVAANLEAMQEMHKDPEKAAQSYARWTQAKDAAQAVKTMKDFLPLSNRSLRWTKETFDVLKDVMASQDQALADIDVTKTYTMEYLDKLQQMGFHDMVGAPKQ